MANPSPKDVQKFLAGLQYPADKEDVMSTASAEGADDDILDMLRDNLPDAIFDNPTDLSQSLGDSMSNR